MSDLGQRFWAKVNKDGPVHPVLGTPCWLWTATPTPLGYGRIRVDRQTRRQAHVVAYELVNGPVPDGMDLDHLCHTHDDECPGGPSCLHRRCVHPEHLEAVPPLVNNSRGKKGLRGSNNATKTHCPHGHPYDEANTVRHSDGSRQCRTCKNEWDARYKKAKAVALS